ncbi:MAG: DMT family transporter [Thermoplasmata archaeon]|nr:DMT family transporter [Thermoplasmata archaeon]MCI4359224.1 DMT family transporter [Thermoplasmata archaeon]
MRALPRSTLVAIVLSLAAALLWAAYYPFVLGVHPSTAPSGLLAIPFLVGGAAFCLNALVRGEGASLRRMWTDPMAWGRVALLVTMQTSVLAATYLTGAVDTALLALLGDVVVTPLLLVVLFAEGSERVRTLRFLAGITLCTAGAGLTILVGGTAHPIGGWGVPIAIVVPGLIALYFLYMARACRTTPTSAVGGQATLAAGLVMVALSPFLPGGTAGLSPPTVAAALAAGAIGITAFYLGPALYFLAMQRAGIVLPAVLMATIPLFTLGFAWAFLGSFPPWLGLLGIPLAVVGAFVALQGEHDPWSPAATG